MIGDFYILTNANKEPVDTSGRLINPHEPGQWMSRATAEAHAATLGLEIAYVLTKNNAVTCVDIDGCRDPVTGEYDERAKKWGGILAGCYVEISRSGKGLHFWGVAEQDMFETFYNRKNGYECYTDNRYIILGTQGRGDPGMDITLPLRANLTPRPVTSAIPETGPVPEYTGPSDDRILINIMLSSRGGAAAAFGSKATVRDLWNGDPDVLARFFPTDGDDAFDRSRADSALLSHLAFWTGKDGARMERLWRMSPLAQSRPNQKKMQRSDYVADSITGAASVCQSVYTKPLPPGLSGPQPEAGEVQPMSDGGVSGYLTIYDQEKHFAGCVYVEEDHRILTPSGRLLPPDRFKVTYGGYEFQMQPDGARPTKDAWEAFTQNRCKRFPRAAYKTFTPSLPFGDVTADAVNTFRPPEHVDVEGDPAPFLDLVARLLPDARDQEIFLTWCAAMVQNPGVKFQWAIAMQGTEGNGKTFLLRCMEHAVGTHLTHFPNPEDMNEKYNTYLEGNLLIGVEEIHMAGRRDMLDRLKKYITNDRVEIRGMGIDKRMGDNLTNWMFLTNHQDAVIKTQNDRRYCVFFTAQQEATDLKRDGMSGRYFPDLWDWARAGGFDIVATYLRHRALAVEFNPAGECNRAPRTSSTDAAISQSMGRLEQDIIEAIEQDEPGFRGGWISSVKLRDHLSRVGLGKVSNHAMNEALKTLGYTPCRSITNGRGARLQEEGGLRPKLYCTDDIQDSTPSVLDYSIAQGYVNPPSSNPVVPLNPKKSPGK